MARKTQRNVSITKHQKASKFLSQQNVGVIFTRDLGHAEILNLTTLAHMKVGKNIKKIAYNIAEYEHFWFYKLFVLLRDPQGNTYIQFADLDTKLKDTKIKARVRQRDISEQLNDAHHKLITKQINSYHMVNTGWLAIPYHPDEYYNPEELIDKYCDIYGCWDYLNKYEAERNEQNKKKNP